MIRIKKGLDLPIEGAAECRISDACGVSTFAVKPTDYVGLVPPLQEVDVLPHGVGRTPVPPGVVGRDRGGEEEETALLAAEVPPLRGIQVLIQRPCIILRQHSHLLDVRI